MNVDVSQARLQDVCGAGWQAPYDEALYDYVQADEHVCVAECVPDERACEAAFVLDERACAQCPGARDGDGNLRAYCSSSFRPCHCST